MKFLADMGVALRVVQWLRENGHDAIHLREENLRQITIIDNRDSDRFSNHKGEPSVPLEVNNSHVILKKNTNPREKSDVFVPLRMELRWILILL